MNKEDRPDIENFLCSKISRDKAPRLVKDQQTRSLRCIGWQFSQFRFLFVVYHEDAEFGLQGFSFRLGIRHQLEIDVLLELRDSVSYGMESD